MSTQTAIEVIVMTMYLHSRKHHLREIIKKLNDLLSVENEVLRNAVTTSTAKMIEKFLRFYTVCTASSSFIWTSVPIMQVFHKTEFYYTDYQLPAVISTQPFSAGVFAIGVVLQMFGSAYTILRKISLDIYVVHLIQMITVQYKCLRIEFEEVIQQGNDNLRNEEGFTSQSSKRLMKEKLRSLTQRYGTVIE